MPEFLNTAQGVLPSAANGAAPTSGDFGYGAYTQITASAPSDLAVTGAMQVGTSGFHEGAYTVLQVARGAAGSEVAMAEFAGFNHLVSGGFVPDPHGCFFPAGIPIKTITSGTRIAVRMNYGSFAVSFSVAIPISLAPFVAEFGHAT